MLETGEEDQICVSYLPISHPLLPDLFLPLPTSILARVICTHQSLLNHTLYFITHCNITSEIVTLREMTSCCSSIGMFVSDCTMRTSVCEWRDFGKGRNALARVSSVIYMTVHLSHFYSYMPTGKLGCISLWPHVFSLCLADCWKNLEKGQNWPALSDTATSRAIHYGRGSYGSWGSLGSWVYRAG